MTSALTKREALTFCRDVLKMSESALGMSDRSVFLNEYASRYTKRIPFTSAFDNYFMNKSGFNWETTIHNIALLHLTGMPWITGILSGKHGSSCAIASTFTKLLFSVLGIKSEIVLSKVSLFPLRNIHNIVVVYDKDERFLVDLGNRLTPLPRLLSLDRVEQSEPVEAGDTYTKLVQTGEKTFERWIGYELDLNNELKDPKLFAEFNLEDSVEFFDECSMTIDQRCLADYMLKWNFNYGLLLKYWAYNVPISGFDHQHGRIIRITNRTFQVQREARIGSKFDQFKVNSFDEYCRHTFKYFPYFENEEFLSTMHKFWRNRYADLN